MGLLETLIARVTKLEQQVGIVATTAVVDEAVEVAAPINTPAAPVVTGDAPLVNNHGIPWNADYHASTKTQNQDGHWKGKKGVEKSVIEAYNAQFTAAPATTAALETPAAPTLTPPPALTPPPSLAVPPAPPAIPAVPAPSADNLLAVKYIQELTNDWSVPYATVVASLIAKHGATDFQSCDAKHHVQIRDEALAWLEALADVDSDIERLTNVGDATGNGSAIAASVATVLQSHGGSQKLAEITADKLAVVSANLKPFADQWEAYAKAQGKM